MSAGAATVARVVRPVREDARGIVAPEAGLAHFRLDRYPPSPAVARFVDRYWVASWDLRGRPPYTQQVLAHPVVNVVFTGGTALVHGVKSKIDSRTLREAGWALGVMFRPAGFRPFLGRTASAITDRVIPLAELFGPPAAALGRHLLDMTPDQDLAGLADRFRAARHAAFRDDHRHCRTGRGRAIARPGGRARGGGGVERPAVAAPVCRPRGDQREGADPPLPAV